MKVLIRSSHLLLVISSTRMPMMVDGFTTIAIAKAHSNSDLTLKINSSALHASLPERHHHQPQQQQQQQPTRNKSMNTSINKMPSSSFSVSSSSSSAALPSLQMVEENENDATSPKIVISDSKRILQRRKRSWVEKSHKYYTTIMRNNHRRAQGQIQRHYRHRRKKVTSTTSTTASTKSNSIHSNDKDKDNDSDEYEISDLLIAHRRKDFYISQQFYFAWKQIKLGKLAHAEQIYRKLIYELKAEMMKGGDECTIMDYDLSSVNGESSGGGGGKGLRTCDNSQLATTTLLLCLLLQRTNQVKATRAAFLEFIRIIRDQVHIDNGGTGMNNTGAINCKDAIVECTCSAKVLQAYALFEMKQGHVKKSYELVRLAVKMDKELEPVLSWKQFRDAKALVG